MAYDNKDFVRRVREIVERDGNAMDLLLRFHEEVDQKASSTLTFLGLLLAGMSFFAVGFGEAAISGGLRVAIYAGTGAVFALAFVAAVLCLTCFNMTGPEDVPDHTVDEILELMARISRSRRKRYIVALACTVAAAILFATVVLLYLATTLFSG